MNRLTRPMVNVDETAAQYMGKEVNLQTMNDRLLELILNGPTLNAVPKDYLRQIIRQLYGALQAYEDIELEPEEVILTKHALMGKSLAEIKEFDGVSIDRLCEMAQAEKEGRLAVLPCKVGDTVYIINRHLNAVFENTVISVRVGHDSNNKNHIKTRWVGPNGNESIRKWVFRQIGNYVFLTREEAEKALEGG